MRYKDYLSFGTSAHSFRKPAYRQGNGKRWWNYSALNFYNAAVESKGNAVIGEEVLRERKLNEYVMLALRSKGLDLLELNTFFGNEW